MRIAIASTNENPDSEISNQAGRAPYWLIYENEKLIETWKNPFAVGGGGAGWSVAKVLADKKIEKVISGKFGANFLTALKENKIEHQEASGKIKDMV